MPVYVPGCQIVGLDVGSSIIKAVQLTTSLTSYTITGFFMKERTGPSPEHLAADLHAIADHEVMQSDIRVISVPSHQVLFRTTELPFTQLGKIAATIRYEAEDLMICPLEEMVVDFALLEAKRSMCSVLVACVSRDVLEGNIGAVVGGGIIPDIIDVDSLALARLMEEIGEDKNLVLLDIGTEKISVSIFQDGKLQFTRSLPGSSGGGNKKNAIGAVLKEVVFSVKAFLDAREAVIEEAWITGGGSRIEGLTTYIEKNLGVDVNGLDVVTKIKSDAPLPEEMNLLGGVATGLALRGLRREKGRIDFSRQLAQPSQVFPPMIRKKVLKVGALLLLLLVLIGVHFMVGIATKEKRYSMLKREIRSVFTEGFPDVRSITNEVEQAKAMVRRMNERGVRIGTNGRHLYLEMIREIAGCLPQDAKIVALEMDGARISLRGTASSFSSVDDVEAGLRASPLIQDVKLGTVELARRGGQGVLFKMVFSGTGQ